MSLPALAALDTVSTLFQEARYEEALEALEQGGEGFRVGEATLWKVRLTTEPDEALLLLREGLADKRLPDAVRTRMTLESADIEFGLGRYQSSLKVLIPLLDENQGTLPGNVYLRAGLALRALGKLQEAREMLASVKPQDQAFLLARFYLGDIALDQKDAALALRYFESAVGGDEKSLHPRVAAGKWRALLYESRDQDAIQLEQALGRNYPGSLAMLEIQRLRRKQREDLEAMTLPDSLDASTGGNDQSRGRYALQLGAFSDRSLALDFLRRYRDRLPDLRIDEVRDERGQFLYKVRSGSYVNPALARTEAKNLARQFDMEVIVADLSGATGRND
ncbi:MAG: SPOR domain-containing protein [Candidatus Krumholzibacteria bacterium]|nr:SPOR domain-containing protein [Candidatus Krumholzibacteria bacterium]